MENIRKENAQTIVTVGSAQIFSSIPTDTQILDSFHISYRIENTVKRTTTPSFVIGYV
jgi:hypothetical protein